MANQCSFCGQRHIATNMLVLNHGTMWIEFCGYCGERNALHNSATGEIMLVREIQQRAWATERGLPFIRTEADIAFANEVVERAEAAQDLADYEYEMARYEEEKRLHELFLELKKERAQLNLDYWDNLMYRCEWSQRYTAPNFLWQ